MEKKLLWLIFLLSSSGLFILTIMLVSFSISFGVSVFYTLFIVNFTSTFAYMFLIYFSYKKNLYGLIAAVILQNILDFILHHQTTIGWIFFQYKQGLFRHIDNLFFFTSYLNTLSYSIILVLILFVVCMRIKKHTVANGL